MLITILNGLGLFWKNIFLYKINYKYLLFFLFNGNVNLVFKIDLKYVQSYFVLNKKGKKKMEVEQELFLHRLAERHPSQIKRKIGIFRRSLEMLHEFLSYDDYYKEREELEYFSKLYIELSPILTEITCYVGGKGYFGKKKKVDRIIFNSQKILGYLKVLHSRYLSLNGFPYAECPEYMENYEIMRELKIILENISTKSFYDNKSLCIS